MRSIVVDGCAIGPVFVAGGALIAEFGLAIRAFVAPICVDLRTSCKTRLKVSETQTNGTQPADLTSKL